jgi:peptidyl-prolyl cis-trans isomerase SurA
MRLRNTLLACLLLLVRALAQAQSWPIKAVHVIVGAMIAIALVPTAAYAEPVDVNGEPITETEIEQRSSLKQVGKRPTPSRDEVIEELRNEKLKIQEARKSGVEITDTEVDRAYATMASRMRLTPEQLTQHLVRSGVNIETVKHLIRADIAGKRR